MDTTQDTMLAQAAEPEVITYTDFTELDRELQNELEREAEGFVRIGYMLKIFRDTNILSGTEYKDVNDYAMKRFHLDKSQVSRFTRINDRFSEGGYSDKLQDKYKGLGYAKLSLMLMLPEAIADEITPSFSKSEVQAIKDELDEERKTTDLEILIEGTDERQVELENNLQKVVWQMLHDNTELYEQVHSLAKRRASEEHVMEKTRITEEYHDILAPQGEAFHSVRIQGVGRMMLSIKESGEDIKVINGRSGAKEEYTWKELVKALERCVDINMPAAESYESRYAETWQVEEKKVAPVQPTPSAPSHKPEPRKQSKVIKAQPPKPKKEAPVAAEEKHEPLPGQNTVADIPGLVPEEYQETVSVEEENKDSVSEEVVEEQNTIDAEETQAEAEQYVEASVAAVEEQKDNSEYEEYRTEFFLALEYAKKALSSKEYSAAIKNLQNAIRRVEFMCEIDARTAEE
ncbi:MAG: hypothetical protein E7290_09370 [Lachnospiraceae bacterium]|nr:hypothetical protein [Lachnospiraceae bacterium]